MHKKHELNLDGEQIRARYSHEDLGYSYVHDCILVVDLNLDLDLTFSEI
eukprot:SAG31_NODE_741_length_12429_cov_13.571127_7_plen_49_part_00